MEPRAIGGGKGVRITRRTLKTGLPSGDRSQGRRTNAGIEANVRNVLQVAVIRRQRICGLPGRVLRRGRSTSGYCTGSSRRATGVSVFQNPFAIRATCEPQVVFPSLRPHKPNPARRGPPGPAGEILEFSLAAGTDPWPFPASARAKPFGRSSDRIDRKASIDEPAHADIHRHAQRQEREQHRRPTVTH